jgi:hypothetical protein
MLLSKKNRKRNADPTRNRSAAAKYASSTRSARKRHALLPRWPPHQPCT